MNYDSSVIIPVYNAENTIRRCVESIIYGKERNLQIILIDDCSTDKSAAICRELAVENNNVLFIKNSKNLGASATRNRGLDIVNSKYVFFVDADDWVSEKYVANLIEIAETHEEVSLPICGFHFWDLINNRKKDYIWNNSNEHIIRIRKDNYFSLLEKVFLQTLWNKVFLTDIIRDNAIRFDEKQTMGEDFQFVLDYILAGDIQTVYILNDPLYYYIRANNNSLMSNFGLKENENEYGRLKQLRQICGDSQRVYLQYEIALRTLKKNYIYQAVHSKKKKKDILRFIASIMQDGKEKEYYKSEKYLQFKECVAFFIDHVSKLSGRFYWKYERYKTNLKIKTLQSKLTNRSVSILSQNCIGGIFYHDFNMRFLSPTINLFFNSRDFIKFVLNLDHYLRCDLKMFWKETYPVGLLDDIIIYFMHYNSCSEAKTAWNRRCSRVDKDRIVVFCTDMEDFDKSALEEWKLIKYPKVLFTAKYPFADNTLYFPEYIDVGKVPDLIPRREFYKNNYVISIINGIV